MYTFAERFWEYYNRENHKTKYFKFSLKIFEVNALKLGATSNIIEELRKNFQKNKRLKKL